MTKHVLQNSIDLGGKSSIINDKNIIYEILYNMESNRVIWKNAKNEMRRQFT